MSLQNAKPGVPQRELSSAMPKKSPSFSSASFLARLLLSLLLVFSTYNPTGYSFYHWIVDFGSGPASLKVVVALLLAILYYATLRVVIAVFRASGLIVAGLAAALFAILLITTFLPRNGDTSWGFYLLLSQYIVLISIAIVIAFGMSWSSLIERLTGQQQKRFVQ